jgi:hypothetical protein
MLALAYTVLLFLIS